jgi:hypothetical protein
VILAVNLAVGFPPLTCPAACPVLRPGVRGWVATMAVECAVTGVWAGQATAVGGLQAASRRFIHSCSRGQPSGRCR